MDVSKQLKPFWAGFLQATKRGGDTPLFDVFYFGDDEDLAKSLAELVLIGTKSATASLLWEYEAEGSRAPRSGDLSIVTSFEGIPLCVIESTDVHIKAFQDVDGTFAADEGEGDKSLTYWRKAHWDYFQDVCERIDQQPSEEMQVICERFKVLFTF